MDKQSTKSNKTKLVKITADELNDLLETTSQVCSELPTKRTRRQAKDRNADYIEAVVTQNKDHGSGGGFVRGSKYHYERSYW
jgi:hypothetical protein